MNQQQNGAADDPELRDNEQEQEQEQDTRDNDQDDAEVEARARRMGWVPEEEWDDDRAEKEGRRKPKSFKSAREYVEAAETSMPMLRSQLRNMDAKLADSQKQVGEMYELMQQNRKLQVEAIERARKEEREKIEAERRAAVADGDTAAFDAAQKKLDDLDKREEQDEATTQPKKAERQEHPAVVAFRSQNKWFGQDSRLTNNLIDEFEDVKNEMPGLTMAEKMEEAKRRLQKRYPEKFGINPRREGARTQVTPPSGSREGGSVERRFAALSREEQEAYQRNARMVEQQAARLGTKDKLTKEDWLKEIGR